MTCVSFKRSLEILCLGDMCAPFGIRKAINETPCVDPWPVCDREAWLHALACAEDEISIDLGAPLCPSEICNEFHRTNCNVQLRYKPVSYLGVRVESEPQRVSVSYSDDREEATVTICPIDQNLVGVDNIVFKYPSNICKKTRLLIPDPCIEMVEDCDGEGGVGIVATWDRCDLAIPCNDSGSFLNDDDFLSEVDWCYWYIDEDQAFSLLGECSCDSCSSCADDQQFSVSLENPYLGEVCFEQTSGCGCGRRRVLVNYATDFNCGRGISPALEQAIVLYALVKMGKDAVCGCSNFHEKLEYWLSKDDSSSQAFAKDIVYGNTRAGMTVWRTMLKVKNRRTFDDNRGFGGYFGSHRVRGFRNTASATSRGLNVND